ncbi:hypothetical protein KR026_008331, partial [Drosophila bipectinata]
HCHCWLCENVVHAKCAGFTASILDAISRRSGIHYCCENCRAVQGEMRSFMRQTKNGFKELITGFRKINDQLCALDTQFNGLHLLNESPKRKKSAVSDPPQPAQLRIIVIQKGIPQSGPPAPTDAAVFVPATPKPLQVIPPSKHIFVSRIAPDTSESDISAYIKAKTKADIKVEDIAIFKYNYIRRTSSIKIRVPAPMFKTICSPSFWPENIFVQEHQPSSL